jgi:dihydroorotate dehydrogenase (fumarate)
MTPTTDLRTRYMGLELANPIVASSSPLTGQIDTLLALQEAGAAAIVLPSLFEEQIEHDAMGLHRGLDAGADQHGEVFGGYFPELDSYNTGPDRYLDTLIAAKNDLAIPVIASLNGTSTGGWTYYAKLLEDEGADALELNIYLIAADANASAADVEDQYLQLVAAVRSTVEIPLAVKIGPYFSSPANMARRLVDAGADGLVLFNRFYQPDIDLDQLSTTPNLVLSSPSEMRLVLRWVAILHGQLEAALAATTGIHDAEAAIKMILAGADVTMMTSALLMHGPEHVTTVLDGLTEWFTEREYHSLTQARGSLSQESSPDPSSFERTNYMANLASYSPH